MSRRRWRLIFSAFHNVRPILSVAVIALPRYVIDYNERCRPDLTCAYTRSEEAEENGPNEGTRKRSVTTHVALVQRREPDFFGYVDIRYLAVLLVMTLLS